MVGVGLLPFARTIFQRVRTEISLGVAHFISEHAAAARRTFRRYGNGHHSAALTSSSRRWSVRRALIGAVDAIVTDHLNDFPIANMHVHIKVAHDASAACGRGAAASKSIGCNGE